MQIHDVIAPFLEHYEPTTPYLEAYYSKHAAHYEQYFSSHVKNRDEKIQAAPEKHLKDLQKIRENQQRLPSIINEVKAKYEALFPIQFTQDVHLLVGVYGSNAYTYRQFNPEIAFCAEKLSSKTEHLQIITAHEFGHATQNLISIKEGIDWAKVEWTIPLTWLLQEGVATFLSTLCYDVNRDIYFAYEDDPAWLTFCEDNEKQLVSALVSDLQSKSTPEIFKEWFSINGGELFGYMRIAYYIGYRIVCTLVEQIGLIPTITLWKEDNFKDVMTATLKQLSAE